MMRILILAVFALALPAQEFAARADAFVASWVRDKQFRGAVLVAKDGQPVFRKAYGRANEEWEIASTPETKFRLGSITKQFTAVAILRLAEQEKLKLTDPVKTYYPEAPAAWDAITLHHLLNHTSGIPSYTDQKDFFAAKSRLPLKPAEIVRLTQEMPLEFPPGTKYRYNNTGYILLGVVLEKVTGVSYADHLKRTIFDPLGMKDSGYDSSTAILKQRASGYRPDGRNADFLDMSLPYAAGSLYSTLDDLLKWDEALHADKLLQRASWETMTKPGLGDYGYGLVIRPVEGRPAQAHGGGINGFSTFMVRVPGERLLVVALANQEGPAAQTVAQSLARMYLGADVQPRPLKTEIKLPNEKLDTYAGRYQLGPNFILRVWREGEHMMTQATGQGPIEIFATAADRFFPKVMEAELVFEPGQDGKVTGLTLHQGGRSMRAPRIE